VTRVDFSADDVARVRFWTGPNPLVETVIALHETRNALSGGEFSRTPRAAISREARSGSPRTWRRQWLALMAAAFPASARPLLDLVPGSLPTPLFIEPVVTDLDEGLELIRAAPRDYVRADLAEYWHAHAPRGARPSVWLRNLADGDREAREIVVRALHDLYRACVEPFWDVVEASFRADLAARISVLATGGYEEMFASLHPQLSWKDQGLVRGTVTSRFALDGSGLQLAPSAFSHGPPVFVIRPGEDGGNLLVYAARSDGDGPTTSGGQHKLGLALGHTRADALRALREPCGTVELATRLHVSASSASEHVAALRAAGLASTARHGRAVRHSLTPLGQSLVGGMAAALAADSDRAD
jgi:DNA-binding transcriptional ArsR family regulator